MTDAPCRRRRRRHGHPALLLLPGAPNRGSTKLDGTARTRPVLHARTGCPNSLATMEGGGGRAPHQPMWVSAVQRCTTRSCRSCLSAVCVPIMCRVCSRGPRVYPSVVGRMCCMWMGWGGGGRGWGGGHECTLLARFWHASLCKAKVDLARQLCSGTCVQQPWTAHHGGIWEWEDRCVPARGRSPCEHPERGLPSGIVTSGSAGALLRAALVATCAQTDFQ